MKKVDSSLLVRLHWSIRNTNINHKGLQRTANEYAEEMMMGLKRSNHVTPILKNLRWLPFEKRIEFKILLITYKTIHGQSADYLKPLIEMYQPLRTLRLACVAGVKSGRGRGNLGARGRKKGNACKDAIVFFIFHSQILIVKIVIGQN